MRAVGPLGNSATPCFQKQKSSRTRWETRASGTEVDGHQQVAELRDLALVGLLLARDNDRLCGVREARVHVVDIQDLRAIDEELRVKRGRYVVTAQDRLDGFGGLGVVVLVSLEDQLAPGEGQAYGGLALGNQRYTLDGLEQGVAIDDGLDRRRIREESAHGGVVTVHEG